VNPLTLANTKKTIKLEITNPNLIGWRKVDMPDKIVSIEETQGAFQMSFKRVMRMVPDRDKDDKKLQRLIAFRLNLDGEAAMSEYLIKKIRDAIKCSYTGTLYDFLKNDVQSKECAGIDDDSKPPSAA
jgi:hypothetical protein